MSPKGRYLQDIHIGRGREGDSQKHDDGTDKLREWDSDKGKGSKIPKFLRTWTSYVKGPKVDRHKSAGGGGREQNRFGKINGISNVASGGGETAVNGEPHASEVI